MKGARALASGMLVLAAICAVPAVSAAQDAGTTTDTTPTTTTTTTTTPTPDPATVPARSTARTLRHRDLRRRRGVRRGSPSDAATNSGVTTTTLSGGSPPDAAPGVARKSASASVTMGDFFFSSASVTVAVGDTVTWHNTGQAPHTATADDGSFDTGTVNPGGSGSHTFNSPGTFSYICTIHPNMKGTIRVLSSSGSSGGSGGGSGSSGSGTSESSAVASPNAAGTSTTLPMTGLAAGALAATGIALLLGGLIMRRLSAGVS